MGGKGAEAGTYFDHDPGDEGDGHEDGDLGEDKVVALDKL